MTFRAAVTAIIFFSAPVAPQTSDSGASSRIMHRLVARLSADTTLPDSLRHVSVADLSKPGIMGFVRTFDDSAAVDFIRTLASTVNQVPETACVRLMALRGGSTPALPALIGFVDSATATSWSVIFEHLVKARATHAPDRQTLGQGEMDSVFQVMFSTLSAGDQDHLTRLMNDQHEPTAPEMCWFSKTMLYGFTQLPLTALAPLARAFGLGAIH